MGTSVISHGNPAPVLESAKHVLDFMALFVKFLVVCYWFFPVFPGRNTGGNSLFKQFVAKPVGVIASVSKEFFGLGHIIKQCSSPFVIACLAFGEMKGYGLPGCIADGMEF